MLGPAVLSPVTKMKSVASLQESLNEFQADFKVVTSKSRLPIKAKAISWNIEATMEPTSLPSTVSVREYFVFANFGRHYGSGASLLCRRKSTRRKPRCNSSEPSIPRIHPLPMIRSCRADGNWSIAVPTSGRAVCSTPESDRQYNWFCDMHRAALSI
jgi:hypothetical protein